MIRAVFVYNIVDDLTPALEAEVNVKVGHTDSLGIQKSLKEQVILHRVNASYAYAVGADACSTRASAGADGDAHALCVANEIVDYQVVIRVAHFVDYAELVFETVNILLRRGIAVAFF